MAWRSPIIRTIPTASLRHVQVKSMFALTHPIVAQELQSVGKSEFGKLLEMWRRLLEGRPWWTELRDLAAAGDYEAVGRMLASRFE